jgi:hypothetical protein
VIPESNRQKAADRIPGLRLFAALQTEQQEQRLLNLITQTSHLKNAVTADGFLLNR